MNGSILICCMGNRCRSPLAEQLLKHRLAGSSQHQIEVSSAGFLPPGVRADSNVVDVLGEIDLDATAHLSRQLAQELVDNADLILAMERAHVRQLAVDFHAFAKAFTVKEFARKAAEHPARPGESLGDWVSRLHTGRKTSDLAGSNADDDTADPIGQSAGVFRATRDELSQAIDSIVAALPR